MRKFNVDDWVVVRSNDCNELGKIVDTRYDDYKKRTVYTVSFQDEDGVTECECEYYAKDLTLSKWAKRTPSEGSSFDIVAEKLDEIKGLIKDIEEEIGR